MSRRLITVAAIFVVIAGVRAAEPILKPILLALFLAIIISPVLRALQDKGVPTYLGIAFVTVVCCSAVGLVGMIIGNSIGDFISRLPSYLEDVLEISGQWIAVISRTFKVDIPADAVLQSVDADAVTTVITNSLLAAKGIFKQSMQSLIVVVLTVFMLIDSRRLPQQMEAAFGDSTAYEHFRAATANIGRYMLIKTIASFATGLLITLYLKMLGVDYYMLWGLLAFLLNFIPAIGSIIAAVPAIIVALVQLGGPSAAAVAAGFLAVNVAIGNILEPRFTAAGLGLSVTAVLVSLLFWGWVLGPVGMFLSAPLTMAFKVSMETREDTRWLGVLLGRDGKKPAEDNESTSPIPGATPREEA
jgi:predicted PurR-regulated permease PerM